MSAPIHVIRIGPYSDGDSTHVPDPRSIQAGYVPADDSGWAEKLKNVIALEILRSHEVHVGQHVVYTIDRLPYGYTVWSKQRQSGRGAGSLSDYYIYGEPHHQTFRSHREFAPHAVWLMDQQGREPPRECKCRKCEGREMPNVPLVHWEEEMGEKEDEDGEGGSEGEEG